jgi:hypothetical protein
MESMTQSNPEFLVRFHEMLQHFDYEPHNFPLKEFETITEAMASLNELSERIIARKIDKSRMLKMVMHDEKFCENILQILRKLEELEFYINNFMGFLEKTTEKTLTEESAKQVSELYNRLNYAIYAACGPEEVHMIKSATAMAEATRGMSYQMQDYCWGNDILDDMMLEHGCSLSDDNSSDDNSSDDDW